MTKLLEWNCSR